MAIFRLIAWFLVALAIALLGADAVTSLEQGSPIIRSTADILGLFGLENIGGADENASGAGRAIATILSLPLWGVVGIIGVVLTLIFRPIE